MNPKTKVQPGDTARVPHWEWVDIKNPEPVRNKNITYEYGGRAGIEFGGTVEVLAVDGDRVLVKYQAPADTEPAGTRCPTGAIFFLKTSYFLGMTNAYCGKKARQDDERARVARLLAASQK